MQFGWNVGFDILGVDPTKYMHGCVQKDERAVEERSVNEIAAGCDAYWAGLGACCSLSADYCGIQNVNASYTYIHH